jgi:hypothetical protein
MNIEELELKINKLKTTAFDMGVMITNLSQEISSLENEIKNAKGLNVEEVKEEVVELPQEEASIELPQVEEETTEDSVELPQVEEEKEEVVEPQIEENKEIAIELPNENKVAGLSSMFGPVEGATVTPLIPVEEKPVEEVKEEVVAAVPEKQGLEPLTPAGVELPSIEEKKEENSAEYKKIDSNTPRAILINKDQSDKLRKSKDLNKSIALQSAQVAPLTTETVVTPVATAEVTPLTPTVDVASEETQSQSKEDINKQLEAMVTELATTTDEAKAAELNSKITALNEKSKVLEKSAVLEKAA